VSALADVKVDFKDVWNGVKDVAELMQSNVSKNMGERAFVAPKTKQPWDLDWTDHWPRHIAHYAYRTSWCSKNLWCDDTDVTVGVVWSAGGKYEGQGRFLHDAYMYAVAHTTLAGDNLTCTGKFSDTPVMINGVARLEGWIELDVKQFKMHDGSYRWDFWIMGNGAGEITRR